MKKKLIIYMQTAAIFKIINEPDGFGNSPPTLVPDALIVGFYKGTHFYHYFITQQERI